MAELQLEDIDPNLVDQVWHEARLQDLTADEVVSAALRAYFGATDMVVDFDETKLGSFSASEERAMASAIDALKGLQ